jgi:hypothetical protein
MRRLLVLTASLLCFTLIIFSCQKEVSFESPVNASGSLQSDANGDCLPKTVQGLYKAGTLLNPDSNYIEVQVNVLSGGPYTITTDTVNGFSFAGSGGFSAAGLNTVRLKANGTPTAAGVFTFTVQFDSTFCAIDVTVLPAGSSGGPAVFTLQGAGGSCGSFTPNGTYNAGTALTSSNTVTVGVNVTTVGTYTVSTNTVNGYLFSATGFFAGTGTQTITLNGAGTPTSPGTNTFTVTAGSSTCTFTITVGNTGPVTCGTANGTYTAGTALTTSNTVTAQHTYNAAGSYNVSTNNVNGYGFGMTNITVSSTQVGTPINITLTGAGTPTAAGTNTFTLNYGDGSTCTFTVTVNAGTVTPTDHFILTDNSWWSYSQNITPTPGDTLKRSIIGTASITGTPYKMMKELNTDGTFDDTLYFRKTGNNYREYTWTDAYASFYFDVAQTDSILMMKEGLNTNDTWTSPEYTGTDGGVPTKLKYIFTCTNNNATVTLNGRTYTNVYIVITQPQVSVNNGPYGNDVITMTNYYAQGVGWIYQKITYQGTDFVISGRYNQVF